MLLKDSIAEDKQGVNHVKYSWLGEGAHEHPEIAQNLAVADKYLVELYCIALAELLLCLVSLRGADLLPRLAGLYEKVVV